MDLQGILYPALILGGLGLVFGLLLAYASKRFHVETDPRVEQVRERLPGANCGGCGFPGCDAYAEAVVLEGAKPNLCAAGGAELAEALAKIMGVSVEASARRVAFVKCKGTPDVARWRCLYEGAADCREAVVLPGGGHKACSFGCLGLGTCVAVCPFDAIHIENSVARVDEAKCVGCGACVTLCPKGLIELVPLDQRVRVACHSTHRGPDVKKACQVGCIGCGLCVKACPNDAVHVENNLARIDPDKCTQCCLCVDKCPTKAILFLEHRVDR
ncbi:electron transport complex, RnfABCDGE type, B subunit [Aminomonas paucivorans DSM 12260]|uniref:Ion-translocating oxidoreductase complex subunit B n=1 Tax=Aminomonas paucivorans DSM 12260 TaxID=584708 RepID=E3CX76_9BACT|nr:Fe-S cluster domain-containing protein [Aminomonas paucivorans]EFQ24423.1 electron transport complex, RnfABCDGE type, B subunit [Aminomonas paucivorans DSM 12260]